MTVDKAFERIYDDTCRKCCAHILSKCHAPEDAADLVQETYLEVLGVLKTKGEKHIKNPEAFVIDTANKKLWAYYRAKNRLQVVASLDTDDAPDLPDEISVTPADAAERALFVREINETLQKKPEKIRKIFALRYTLDLPLAEIAERLGLTLSDVKTSLYRTLAELREIYGEQRSE